MPPRAPPEHAADVSTDHQRQRLTPPPKQQEEKEREQQQQHLQHFGHYDHAAYQQYAAHYYSYYEPHHYYGYYDHRVPSQNLHMHGPPVPEAHAATGRTPFGATHDVGLRAAARWHGAHDATVVEVPEGPVVNWIIGAKGANINALQAETGSVIEMQHSADVANDAKVRTVTIYAADEAARSRSADRIRAKVAEFYEMQQRGQSEQGEMRLHDEDAVRIEHSAAIPKEDARRLIGPAGVTIRRLRSLTGANIKVGDTDVSAPHGRADVAHQRLTVSGMPKQVEAAQLEIKRLLESPHGSELTDTHAPLVSANDGRRHEVTRAVFKEDSKRIIGPGGATINRLREDSRAFIKVENADLPPEPGQPAVLQNIKISGTEAQVQEAERLIAELLSMPLGSLSMPLGAGGSTRGGRAPGRWARDGANVDEAVGTARPGDWSCPNCKANVYASRSQCFRCHTRKPAGSGVPAAREVDDATRGGGQAPDGVCNRDGHEDGADAADEDDEDDDEDDGEDELERLRQENETLRRQNEALRGPAQPSEAAAAAPVLSTVVQVEDLPLAPVEAMPVRVTEAGTETSITAVGTAVAHKIATPTSAHVAAMPVATGTAPKVASGPLGAAADCGAGEGTQLPHASTITEERASANCAFATPLQREVLQPAALPAPSDGPSLHAHGAALAARHAKAAVEGGVYPESLESSGGTIADGVVGGGSVYGLALEAAAAAARLSAGRSVRGVAAAGGAMRTPVLPAMSNHVLGTQSAGTSLPLQPSQAPPP